MILSIWTHLLGALFLTVGSSSVAVVVAFFICWAPFHAQRLLAVHAQSRNTKSRVIATVYAILTYLSGILYYLSTTVNPVLYHIMSHKFREAFKTTLAQQCGWGRKKIVKHRSYSVLSRYNHNVHNCAQPQQHLHRLPSASDDSPCQQLPEIQLRKINNNTSPEEKFKERKNNATENQGENLNNSYPQYHPRQRVPSNSSQTTMTTSLGKLSLGDGNNFRSDPTLALTQGENCLEEECVKENGTCTRNSDVANRGMPQSNRHMRECVCDNCRRFKADTTITPTKRFLLRSCSGVSPFGALTRKLRALSVSTKSMFVPHHKSLVNVDSLNNSSPQRHRVTSDASLNSGRSTNTISNSSLQDLDENEFVGAELALYMGELNGQS